MDANNLTNENSSIGLLKFQIEVLQSHLPERLHKVYVVNMSWFVQTIWYIVKPMVKDSTKRKIVMIGDNVNEIFNNLKQEIDEDVIPMDLGGKNPI